MFWNIVMGRVRRRQVFGIGQLLTISAGCEIGASNSILSPKPSGIKVVVFLLDNQVV
jgi:hypothetical protein